MLGLRSSENSSPLDTTPKVHQDQHLGLGLAVLSETVSMPHAFVCVGGGGGGDESPSSLCVQRNQNWGPDSKMGPRHWLGRVKRVQCRKCRSPAENCLALHQHGSNMRPNRAAATTLTEEVGNIQCCKRRLAMQIALHHHYNRHNHVLLGKSCSGHSPLELTGRHPALGHAFNQTTAVERHHHSHQGSQSTPVCVSTSVCAQESLHAGAMHSLYAWQALAVATAA